jgi:hypothetical protein
MASLKNRFATRGRRSYPCGAPLQRSAVRDTAPRKAQKTNRRKNERKGGRRYRFFFLFYVEKAVDWEKTSTRDWH